MPEENSAGESRENRAIMGDFKLIGGLMGIAVVLYGLHFGLGEATSVESFDAAKIAFAMYICKKLYNRVRHK